MQLFNYFEPLIQYVTTQQKENFANVNFKAFDAVIINLINDLDKKADKVVETQSLNLAKLAVFSWIDELVQRSNWIDKGLWQQQLLQERYLSTANAGEIFFSTLANLNEADAEIIRVYYRCLILGFRGKYYRPEDIIEIREIEKHCLSMMNISASVNETETENIFPRTYDSLRTKPLAIDGIANVKKWYQKKFILIGLPIVILVVIYFFFYGVLHLTISNYIALLK